MDKIVWLQAISCNGNNHSFLNDENLAYICDIFEFVYHPTFECKYTLSDLATQDIDIDYLLIEGAVGDIVRAGIELLPIITKLAQKARYIIAVGTCASFGGLFATNSQNKGLIYTKDEPNGILQEYKEKIINLSGCPIHPSWLSTTLLALYQNKPLHLDELQRPKEIYSYLSHHGCVRNEYFEWKVDATSLGKKEGCLFYSFGCRAPMTHSSCNKILWNGISSKTRAGLPCFGCTAPSFPRINMFCTKTNMSIPQDIPLGISKRAYLSVSTIAKTFHIQRLEEDLI